MLVSVCCLQTLWSERLKMDASSIVGVYNQKRKGINCCLPPFHSAENIVSFLLQRNGRVGTPTNFGSGTCCVPQAFAHGKCFAVRINGYYLKR